MIRYLLLVAIGIAALVAQVAYAAFPPYAQITGYRIGQDGNVVYPSAAAACAAAADSTQTGNLTASFEYPHFIQLSRHCEVIRNSDGQSLGVVGIFYVLGPASCPPNSTLINGQCSCTAPSIENPDTKTCTPPTPCQWAKDMQVAGGSFMIETGKSFCHSGCSFTLAPDAGPSPFRAKQDGKWYEQRYQGDFKGTGGGAMNCGVGDAEEEPQIDPPEEKPDAPDQPCPPGQTAGAQIITPGGGGGYVCSVPQDSESTEEKTTETTNPDGSTTLTTTQTTTVCGISSCNTTITTSVSSGGTTQTTTEESSQNKDAFCKSKPADKNCTGSGGGGAGTPGADQSTPDHPKLWEKKYPDGLAGVWSEARAAFLNTDIGRLAPKLMPDNIPTNGVVPVWNLSLDVGIANFGVHDFSPSPMVWGWAKIFVILGALLLARALIFGG